MTERYQEGTENRGNRIYRPRPYEQISQQLDQFQEYLSGGKQPLELTQEERMTIKEWEKGMAEQLEKYFGMVIRTVDLNIKFLGTERGKLLWKEIMGEDLSDDPDLCRKQVYAAGNLLGEKDNQKVIELMGDSDEFADRDLANRMAAFELGESNNRDWTDSIDRGNLLLDTNILFSKFEGLQQMRLDLRKKIAEGSKSELSNEQLAQHEIRKLYLARINELIVEMMQQVLFLQQKKAVLGEELLNDQEKNLLSRVKSSRNLSATLARLDKFLYGVSEKIDHNGNYEQVSELTHAKILATLADRAGTGNYRITEDRGLEKEKVFEQNIGSEQRAEWGRRVLASYGLLSEYDSAYYLNNPQGPPPDMKWQYVPRADSKNKIVDSTVQCVKDPAKKKENILNGLVVSCAHEVEGHVLQNENKKGVELRLFDLVGGDRRSLMSEAGALYLESKVLKDGFGVEKSRNTTYVRAMKRKLAGGTYVDCLEEVVGSLVSAKRAQYNLADEAKREVCKKELADAIKKKVPSVRRVFHKAALLDNDNYLTKSKDTVYVEQEILMEQLEKRGLTKLAFVGGLNVSTMLVLTRLGLFDPTKIKAPHLETMKIWKEIEKDYKREVVDAAQGQVQ